MRGVIGCRGGSERGETRKRGREQQKLSNGKGIKLEFYLGHHMGNLGRLVWSFSYNDGWVVIACLAFPLHV